MSPRSQVLVEALEQTAIVGPTPAETRLLRTFYDAVPDVGWAAELGRGWLTCQTDQPLTHEAWSSLLGLPDGPAWRALAAAPGGLAAPLGGLAEAAFRYYDAPMFVTSREMQRWRRAVRADRDGRPFKQGRPAERVPTWGPEGRALEEHRLGLGWPLSRWCAWLGVAPNTYRRALELEPTRTGRVREFTLILTQTKPEPVTPGPPPEVPVADYEARYLAALDGHRARTAAPVVPAADEHLVDLTRRDDDVEDAAV